jgi:hypothetical protein
MEPFEWAVPSQNFIRNRNLDDFDPNARGLTSLVDGFDAQARRRRRNSGLSSRSAMRLNRLSAPTDCSMRAQSLQNFRKESGSLQNSSGAGWLDRCGGGARPLFLRCKTQTHRHHRTTRDKRRRNYLFLPTDRVSGPALMHRENDSRPAGRKC